MTGQHITLLLGGTYHDFTGFADVMTPFLQSSAYEVEVTDDPAILSALGDNGTDLLVLYTCLGGTRDEHVEGTDFTSDQVSSLVDWIQRGGALVALHASSVCGVKNRKMRRLLGGFFIMHPPGILSFTVTPASRDHPITRGLEAFEVSDEFYVQSHDETVEIHMTAVYQDISHPMVWSRVEGKGRVVHIAPGHDRRTWVLPAYRRLLLQSLQWAAADWAPAN